MHPERPTFSPPRPSTPASPVTWANLPAPSRPQAQPYQQPVQQPVVIVRETNGKAVASLVFSILWLFWIGSLIGFVLGLAAQDEIDRSNGTQGGKGLAIAGTIISGVALVPVVLVIVAALMA